MRTPIVQRLHYNPHAHERVIPLLTAAYLLLCSFAVAEPGRGAPAVDSSPSPRVDRTAEEDASYYTFDDDSLDAMGRDALGAVLHARPGPVRTLLIRPRVQFVTELLTTVEQM